MMALAFQSSVPPGVARGVVAREGRAELLALALQRQPSFHAWSSGPIAHKR